MTPALSGITAAVVGVILNLAVVFAIAVLFPAGFGHDSLGLDWFAIAVTASAFVALRFLRIEAVWVVLAGGAAGLLRSLLR